MTAGFGFQIFNGFAMVGWLALGIGVITGNARLRDQVAGLIWPALLAVGYVVILGGAMTGALGDGAGAADGLGTLDGVMAAFSNPWIVLGAWIHYLVFDLFVGTRIAQEAERDGVPKLWLLPILPLTLMFGPAGYLLFVLIRPFARRST